MITTNNVGFTEAKLHTSYGARIHMDLCTTVQATFRLMSTGGPHYDEASCREASEFFLKLADELKRRKQEGK